MSFTKPLLAGTIEDTATLPYPVYISPKLDGIRAINPDGDTLVSRNLKNIPNKHVQMMFGADEFQYLDGELICGDPTDKDCYLKTNSAVMSHDGTPDVTFYVFDHIEEPEWGFEARLDKVVDSLNKIHNLPECADVRLVPHRKVYNEAQLLEAEALFLAEGYEGVMVRVPNGRYKMGRSTLKEAILLKLKRFQDDEAEILDVYELESNQNEATVNKLGHTERSSEKAGMVKMNTLGGLHARDLKTGVTFSIGSGFTAAQRKEMWENQQSLIGTVVKYKHFPIGAKDKPRFPIYLGPRAEIDL